MPENRNETLDKEIIQSTNRHTRFSSKSLPQNGLSKKRCHMPKTIKPRGTGSGFKHPNFGNQVLKDRGDQGHTAQM